MLFERDARVALLIEVERVSVGRFFVLLRALHRLAELLFEKALAVFHRAQLLREDLVANLLAALKLLRHLLEGRERLGLLLMGDDRAGLRVYDERRLAAGAYDCPALCLVGHVQHSFLKRPRHPTRGRSGPSITRRTAA